MFLDWPDQGNDYRNFSLCVPHPGINNIAVLQHSRLNYLQVEHYYSEPLIEACENKNPINAPICRNDDTELKSIYLQDILFFHKADKFSAPVRLHLYLQRDNFPPYGLLFHNAGTLQNALLERQQQEVNTCQRYAQLYYRAGMQATQVRTVSSDKHQRYGPFSNIVVGDFAALLTSALYKFLLPRNRTACRQSRSQAARDRSIRHREDPSKSN